MRRITNSKGFSALEVLLAMGIVTMIAVFTVPNYQLFQVRNDARAMTLRAVDMLNEARLRARAGDRTGDWGVNFTSSEITLFQGSTFASRNTSLDTVFPLPSTVTVSAPKEIVFEHLYASTTPDSVALNFIDGSSNTISVNQLGAILE